MKNTFNGWSSVDNFSLDTTVDLIVTGRKAAEARPDTWLFPHIEDPDSKLNVLDFGCGVGRNSFGMGEYAPKWSVVGYDNDGMLNKTKDFFALHYQQGMARRVRFSSSWEELTTMNFDVIFCCLVLQHIYEDALVQYSADFRQMTKRLIVTGRRINDDPKGRSTWSILEEQGLIPVEFLYGNNIVPYVPEGAPEDHNTAIYDLSRI